MMERIQMGHMMANTTMNKIPRWILMPLVMTRRRSTMSLVKALTTLMALQRAVMSLVKALIILIVPMRTMMSLMEALPILILMRILYHIQMVNNLCGYLGLLMRDSESYSGTDDPANVGAIIPLFCQGGVNPANAGVDAPIYPISDLGLISPTDTLITTQLLPLDVPSFLYQNQHSFYPLFFL